MRASLMTELSISDAARAAPDRPAIETASRTLRFTECAAAVANAAPTPSLPGAAAPTPTLPAGAQAHALPPVVAAATPSIDTVLAVYAALEARRPIALL